MYLLLLAVILLLMKWQEIEPVAQWSWWWIAVPFGLTAAWWMFADWSGYTKRKAMEKDAQRKEERHRKQREALSHAAAARRR